MKYVLRECPLFKFLHFLFESKVLGYNTPLRKVSMKTRRTRQYIISEDCHFLWPVIGLACIFGKCQGLRTEAIGIPPDCK